MNAKEVVFADDFSVTGSLNGIKDYWDKLTAIGPKYGYFFLIGIHSGCKAEQPLHGMELQGKVAQKD